MTALSIASVVLLGLLGAGPAPQPDPKPIDPVALNAELNDECRSRSWRCRTSRPGRPWTCAPSGHALPRAPWPLGQGGWIFETFPILLGVDFADDALTRAAARVRIGYEGATVLLEKRDGVWVATGLTGDWIE